MGQNAVYSECIAVVPRIVVCELFVLCRQWKGHQYGQLSAKFTGHLRGHGGWDEAES